MTMKKELTPEMEKAAVLWMTKRSNGMTDEDIARECNITRRTLYRWRQFPQWKEFCREYARESLADATSEILETLKRRAAEGKNPKWTQLWAQITGLLGSESVRVEVSAGDERSNAALEAELAELRELLGIDDETNIQ